MCYMLLGFYAISNNILKQSVAMLIMICAYEFLAKNKKVKFVLLTLLAATFHTTAIIAAILMVFSRIIKPSYKNLWICVLVGIVSIFLYNVMGNILGYISILARYQKYFINTSTFSSMLKETIGVAGYAIIYTLITIVVLTKKEKIKEDNPEVYKRIPLLMLGVTTSIFAINNWTINRIALYLYQFVIVILPTLFSLKYTIKGKKIYIFMILLILVTSCSFLTIFAAENEYYQYKTYFNTTPQPY